MNQNSIHPQFSFGIFADTQYANKKRRGSRFFKLSLKKLNKCVRKFNSENLDFIVNLGDLIDGGEENIEKITKICDKFIHPLYSLLGNHDYNVSDNFKLTIQDLFSIKNRYHSFLIEDWKMIFLDGNEISLYTYPKDSKEHLKSLEYYNKNNITKPLWDGGVSKKQLKWLDEELKFCQDEGYKVIIFCHFPIYPDTRHTLWNVQDVFTLINRYSCVKAYFAGHNHSGSYAEKDKIHYITCKGMVELWRNAYSIVNVFSNKIEILGFGNEKSRILNL